MDFGIWLLMGAALVFFMNAGFAMVEAGFTRAKNAANIIMKNLIDFSLGALTFAVIGFSIMCTEDYVFGIFGIPNLSIFTDFANFDYSNFVFNLVFCATAATIVSGAMAERTKFSAYCIYSIAISAIIYPIEAGWVWNSEGWLAQMGYIDFAGSSAIHMVGGISAFVGAAMLGPRIGKYVKDKKTGETKVNAIPGHSLTLGALGCFILWFGWYGFNGAAAANVSQLGSIFLTTTLAPTAAAVSTMTFTWLKNGKPDVSMSLNGALGGLVAITAGCSNVDAFGAIIIGIVAGILVVIGVEAIDMKVHVDDPVGAVAVHGINGIWGTLAVGLFAKEMYAGNIIDDDHLISDTSGLFYGGGLHQLGVQSLGVITIMIWTFAAISLTFFAIKKVHGLRVEADDEILGLDYTEHGLQSSYADFMPLEMNGSMQIALNGESGGETVSMSKAVPVTNLASDGSKLTKVTIITRRSKFDALREVFETIGITGITVTNVMGYGTQRGHTHKYRGVPLDFPLQSKIQIDIVISTVPVETLVSSVREALYTGKIGDGKIFIYDVENVMKIRTGEQGTAALQDSE